jgi:hypothetical protein
MYDIFILSIYCTVKPTTTYTFISQKIKETQKRSDLFLFYKLKLVYSTSFKRMWKQSQAWENNCVIKCSCHPWITYESDLIFFLDFFFTYGKSVLVNKINVVNHSHSYVHKKIDLYYSKFTWVSRLFSEICEPIKIPFWIL